MAIYEKEHIQQGIVEYLDVLWNNQEDRIEDAFELLKNLTEVEVIENSNGTAIRFPFGLQVCLGKLNGVLRSGTGWTFPQAFTNTLYASAVDVGTTAHQLRKIGITAIENHRIVMYPYTDFTTRTETEGPIYTIAVGFWK